MTDVETLERPAGYVGHTPDEIDELAEQFAQELVEHEAEQILANKSAELIKIFDKLDAQYAGRRVSSMLHVGDIISETTTIATRTQDWLRLDEVFTKETIYDPINKQPMSRYRVDMLQANGVKTVELYSDGTMRFGQEIDGVRSELAGEDADVTMLELVDRAEKAVIAYQIRKEKAAEDGIDPSLYSDVADAHARSMLLAAGYSQPRETTLE